MDTAGSGRVFSHPGRNALGMKDSIMGIRGRLFLCLLAGLIIVALSSVLSCSETKQPDTGRNVSDSAAPDFILKDLTGRDFKLSAARGKPVLLIFLTTWCPTCRSEIPHYKDIYETYGQRGLEVVGIDIEEPKNRVSQFAAKNQIPYKTLLDEKGRVASAYDIVGIPTMVLINKDGRVLTRKYFAIDTVIETLLEKK
ncbi:MAG: TlpA family protein disulfide reductase [Deltaproteobacteria bacterium]|nr:MAG: TlpA family protein disulfide reductase [Deltaproteobacteria bacterium]